MSRAARVSVFGRSAIPQTVRMREATAQWEIKMMQPISLTTAFEPDRRVLSDRDVERRRGRGGARLRYEGSARHA